MRATDALIASLPVRAVAARCVWRTQFTLYSPTRTPDRRSVLRHGWPMRPRALTRSSAYTSAYTSADFFLLAGNGRGAGWCARRRDLPAVGRRNLPAVGRDGRRHRTTTQARSAERGGTRKAGRAAVATTVVPPPSPEPAVPAVLAPIALAGNCLHKAFFDFARSALAVQLAFSPQPTTRLSPLTPGTQFDLEKTMRTLGTKR